MITSIISAIHEDQVIRWRTSHIGLMKRDGKLKSKFDIINMKMLFILLTPASISDIYDPKLTNMPYNQPNIKDNRQ
jgi:hypothetical protein